jgi:glycosyltransferase involved in cell wall biosynthesis
MLAEGLSGRGIGVSVLGPSSADAAFGFGALGGVAFSPVEFGDRPRARDVAAVLRLRRLLGAWPGQSGEDQSRPGRSWPGRSGSGRSWPSQAERPGVVHAHGLRAGALTVLALAAVRGVDAARSVGDARSIGGARDLRRRRRPGLVVTVHNAPPSGPRARALIYWLLERIVARRADLVLCVSADLEARMRTAGAHQTARAIVPTFQAGKPPPASQPPAVDVTTVDIPANRGPVGHTPRSDAPATSTPLIPPTFFTSPVSFAPSVHDDAAAAGRPLVLAVGRLAAQKGFDVLLDAAARWRDRDPVPLLAIAGDGPLARELRTQASSLGVDAAFLGHRGDIADLLAAAAVFVLPSRWEGQPLILQEALRGGAAIVAARVGGIPDLVGHDAALLFESGDATALAVAVSAVLTDPSLASRLRAAASRRGAALPTQDDAIDAVLAAYAHVGYEHLGQKLYAHDQSKHGQSGCSGVQDWPQDV